MFTAKHALRILQMPEAEMKSFMECVEYFMAISGASAADCAAVLLDNEAEIRARAKALNLSEGLTPDTIQ